MSLMPTPSAPTPDLPPGAADCHFPALMAGATMVERRRNPEWRATLVRRVRHEYEDLPGMHLSPRQAQRLFALRLDICERILEGLALEGFLSRAPDGTYVRRDVLR